MFALVTLKEEGIVKDEVLEVIGYRSTRFHALKGKGPIMDVILRDNGPFVVWADEVTLHP